MNPLPIAVTLALTAALQGCATLNTLSQMGHEPQDALRSIDHAWLAPDGHLEIGIHAYLSEDWAGAAVLTISAAELEAALEASPGPAAGAQEYVLPRGALLHPQAQGESRAGWIQLPVVHREQSLERDPDLDDLVPAPESPLTVYDLSGHVSLEHRARILVAISRREPDSAESRYALLSLAAEDPAHAAARQPTMLDLLVAMGIDVLLFALLSALGPATPPPPPP